MDGIVTNISAKAAADVWLPRFRRSLGLRRDQAYRRIFADDCHWRDILALTWDLRHHLHCASVAQRMAAALSQMAPRAWRFPLAARHRDVSCAQASTRSRRSSSSKLRLVPATVSCAWSPKAAAAPWTLLTSLDEIRGHGDPANGRRWQDVDWKRNFGGRMARPAKAGTGIRETAIPPCSWWARRRPGCPSPLGLLGLASIRLSWIARRASATVSAADACADAAQRDARQSHTCMPFPRSWPVFIPKDMLANWFEIYAEAMELNVWTQTELVGGWWDAAAGCWEVQLKRGDGTERRMRPRHIVFANGVSTTPIMPQLHGLNEFHGAVRHSGTNTAVGWIGRASARWCWAPARRGTTLPRTFASRARRR